MRIAVFSDIHEDIFNLRKMISRIERSGYDILVCLGDISGFSLPYYKYTGKRDAHECLKLMREKCDIIIPGNHDYYASKRIPDNSGIFSFPENWFHLDYQERAKLAGNMIWLHEENDLDPLYTKEDILFLRTLPEFVVYHSPAGRLLFSHYVWPNLSGFQRGFYTRETEFNAHFNFMNQHNCNYSFTGHSHVKGMYIASRDKFKHYGYQSVKSGDFPVCIGIPPLTRHKRRSGFCIFDCEKKRIYAIKL